MYSKSVLLVLASLCLFCSAEHDAVDMFKDDIAKAAEKAKEFGEHIAKMLGLDNLPAGSEVVDIIKTQAKNFADKAEQVQQQFDNELKRLTNSTVAEGFSEFNKKVMETVTALRSSIENSPATEKALELQSRFQDGITALLDESKKIALELEPQVVGVGSELEKLTTKVLKDAVDSLGQLQDKLHETTGHGNHPMAPGSHPPTGHP